MRRLLNDIKIIKITLLLLVISLYFVTTGFSGCAAEPFRKPLPPLKISIAPVAGTTSAEIKPGDVVELKVTATSVMEVPEMRIDVRLTGGAKLVSGETSWTGPAAKNEEKSLLLTVQAPEKGKGRVTARVSTPPSKSARFFAQARFELGPEDKIKNKKHEPVIKKDSRGRDIIEYR